MKIILIILLGFAAFWYWFLYGSSDHCPGCGRSLIDYPASSGPLLRSNRRRSCACGWHE